MKRKEYHNAIKTFIFGFTLVFMVCWLYYKAMWLLCS